MIIHCDGGARGNPGPAASAFAVYEDDNTEIFIGGKYLGETTNNQAEYTAVELALDWVGEQNTKPKTINFKLDSQLVVNQLNGVYKIKEIGLQQKAMSVRSKINSLLGILIKFNYVPRESNSVADKKVNEILDSN